MPEIVDTLEELTPAWFTAALRQGQTIAPDTAVTGAECRYIGTGQLGSVILAELSYDRRVDGVPERVIVKQPSTDPGSRGMGAAMGVYRSEVRFYEDIAPLVDIAVPALHWSALEEDTGRFVLVLDDLSQTSVVGDMMAGATPRQVELAVGALAGLQAPFWDDPRARSLPWLGDLAGTRSLFDAVPMALEPFVARFGERLEPHQLKLVRELGPKAPQVVDLVWRPPLVVAHGDYRLDNMLFGGPGAPAISVIDWQAARLAPPGLDPAIFLASCVDTPTRRSCEVGLLTRHAEALAAAGVRDFGADQLWESYRASSLYPLLLTMFMSITVEQTERGDAMWTQLLQGAAELVADVDAVRILD